MIESGVDIVLACGGTGEFAYLTETRKCSRVNELTCRHVERPGRCVRADLLHQHCRYRGQLEKPPWMAARMRSWSCRPISRDRPWTAFCWHYEAVAKSVKVPLVVYNIPQNTNIDITPEIFSKLMKIENIPYIKDSPSNLVRIQQLVATGGPASSMAAIPIAYHALLAGCIGCIWGAVNAMPKEAVELYRLVAGGKLAEAAALWQKMLPAQLFFWTHDYNPSIKAATNIAGRSVGECRKPLQPLGEADMAALRKAMKPLSLPASQAAQ